MVILILLAILFVICLPILSRVFTENNIAMLVSCFVFALIVVYLFIDTVVKLMLNVG